MENELVKKYKAISKRAKMTDTLHVEEIEDDPVKIRDMVREVMTEIEKTKDLSN